jgi:protein involved in polysaccharide export with SLBB domain
MSPSLLVRADDASAPPAGRHAARTVSRRPTPKPLRVLALVLLAAFLAALLAGFAPPVHAQPDATGATAAPPAEYRIGRGDDLDLRFFYTPELNSRATVRSDGRISIPLVGEVVVEGRTVGELAALVERLLEPQVRRAQVAINVHGSATQRIFVGGEVGRPGVQTLSGPMTALQAVMVAEGVKDTAQPSKALVLRRAGAGGRQVLKLDLQAVMNGESSDGDLVLQPFDVVVVPRSGIADVGRWVDLYIRRTLPVSFGVSYTVDRNGSATR